VTLSFLCSVFFWLLAGILSVSMSCFILCVSLVFLLCSCLVQGRARSSPTPPPHEETSLPSWAPTT